MEIRVKDIKIDYNSEQRKIGGYINVVERPSETLYSKQRGKWFNEVIKQGAFTRALQKNSSIPLLLEHDWDKQIAHTSTGTLELREDAIGLRFDAVVDENTFDEIQQRNITSCSFGFKTNEEEYETINPKLEKRYVTNMDLFEVSLVANPAYVGSIVEQRNMEEALKELENDVVESVEEANEEIETNDNDVEIEKAVEETSQEAEINEEQEVDETRNIDIDLTSSEVKSDAKEVVDDVIEQTQKDAEFYGEIAKNIDEYKEEVKESADKEVQSLENESLYYTTLAYTKWLEVARLKQISMNL